MTDNQADDGTARNEATIRTRPFQILSLDGGGIKGLFSAAVLAAIEEDLNTTVVDHFDLITGTSTGGIIALGLGAGMRPREIVEFYLSKGPAIFKDSWRLRSLSHWLTRKFPAEPLVAALQSCFKDKRLANCNKRLVIPSYNIGDDDVYIFRTPHAPRLKRDYKVPLWKVAQATSAAPSYFPSCRCIDSLRLIDGGVWANNPTLVGIVEATGTLGIPMGSIRVFSIGTSDPVTSRPRRLNEGGKIGWARGGAALDVIMRGQSLAVNNQAKFLLGKEHVERLDPKVPYGDLSLDGVHRIEELVGKASHHSRTFMPTFESKFLDHVADAYQPLYT
jgi:patatin-like phospholipase/acyl hydrolase